MVLGQSNEKIETKMSLHYKHVNASGVFHTKATGRIALNFNISVLKIKTVNFVVVFKWNTFK